VNIMKFKAMNALIAGGGDLLFPRRCAACGDKIFRKYERKMCADCWSDILFLHQPLCRICGMELAGESKRNHVCGSCLGKPPPYLLARSVVRYSTVVQKLLYGLKYGADTSVLPGIAEILAQFDMTPFDQCDYVVPVPLHFKRLRRRGFNQSVLLAKLIFRKNTQSILRTNILVRTRNTVPQTTLNGVKRRKNLKGAFDLVKKAEIDQKIICLVDDVYTTGTTVSECSRIFYSYGAKEVKIITLTRVEMSRRGSR
jgi:ComF family protein